MEIKATAPTPAIKALLVANELPIDDLDDPSIELFAAMGDTLLGVVGIQRLDGCVLLRSLAVATKSRGLGAQLCAAAIAGHADVWLLTTSARDYFARRGFEVVERDQVHAAVRATAQFSTLCPSTATVMRLKR